MSLVLNDQLNKNSIYFNLIIIIVGTVLLVMSAHAFLLYQEKRSEMVSEIKESSKSKINIMNKNIAKFIESYAVNEYEKFILHHMNDKNVVGIVVEDYNMGNILGKEAYITGKVKDKTKGILDYKSEDSFHRFILDESYHVDTEDIYSQDESVIGKISIYSTDYYINMAKNEIIVRTLSQALIISSVLILFLIINIRNVVLKPISSMIYTIQHSGRNGIPLNKIFIKGSYEVSVLAKTINAMIDSIKSTHKELEEQKAELIAQKDTLHYQAHHDALTGLANRVLFYDRLEHAIEKSKKLDSKIAVLFIDLDHFKEINDSVGHDVGDDVLVEVSSRLQNVIRKQDTLSRLGGDEFTVLLENIVRSEDVSWIASKILATLQEAVKIDDKSFFISSSIGISIYPDDGETSIDLLKYADAAMYKAKDEGRNNFQYYSSDMTEKAFERIMLETNIRQGLENEEFVVYYQPQIDGTTDTMIGMEALVRWNHPSMGIVSPAKFMPVAESSGLIVKVDRYVMKHAMQQVSDWYAQGKKPGVVSLNLCIQQLQQKDFFEVLKSLMIETQCKAEWIELEVTEGQVMTRPEEAIKILQEISNLGIRLAVDDFGTGYSSLSYLKRLPIDKLKIDQSFIRDLPDDEEDIAISKAVISLAENLNLKIIAEGVETQEQKEFLVENGCSLIQGYLYSKPIPADELQKEFLS